MASAEVVAKAPYILQKNRFLHVSERSGVKTHQISDCYGHIVG